jgi:hypothetical protein
MLIAIGQFSSFWFVVGKQQCTENGNQECTVFGNKNAQLVSK